MKPFLTVNGFENYHLQQILWKQLWTYIVRLNTMTISSKKIFSNNKRGGLLTFF